MGWCVGCKNYTMMLYQEMTTETEGHITPRNDTTQLSFYNLPDFANVVSIMTHFLHPCSTLLDVQLRYVVPE